MKLVSKLNNISFDEITSFKNSSIQLAHDKLLAHSIHKTRRMKSNYERGRKFFEGYTDFDLHHQSRIIFTLTKCRSDLKAHILTYYNQLRKYTPELPELVETDSVIPWKQITHLDDFGMVVDKISRIATNENLTLIADMWLHLCLGLRPVDLKRVRILTANGNGAMMIKIKEMKTQKTIIRYIPKSLIQLVSFTKATYPIS